MRLKKLTLLLTLCLATNALYAANAASSAPATMTPAQVAAAEADGRKVAEEADRRNRGWGDMQADLAMTLKNAYGEESRRALRLRTLEVIGDGDKSLVTFDEPADVKGTALLSHAYVKKADDQWLYFPATKRVKRIASNNKSGPFMGSEFAYEDMAPWELDKYSYKLLGEQKVQGMDAYMLEMVPIYEDSGYTRQVVMLDKQEYRPLQLEYYDRKGALLKTQVYSGYAKYENRFWRAAKIDMVNHLTKKQTTLQWRNYAFHTGINAATFDKDALTHIQ